MAWFAVDDGFDTHPKVRKAGNAAAGLFCRLGSYSARHLTEGRLDPDIVRDYGTAATVRRLVEVGMLHPVQHDCAACEQPVEGGYVIHDYLKYNKSRAQVETAREHGRKRQQKGRDEAREKRDSRDSDAKLGSNWRHSEPDSDSDSRENEDRFPEGTAGHEGESHRDTLQGATGVPSHPLPSHESPTETPPPPPPSEPDRGTAVEVSGRGEIQPLIDAMYARGMSVSWTFSSAEWIDLRGAVRRAGVPALVDHAARAWQAAKSQPYSARYFLRGWTGLQEPTAYTGPRAVAGPPSKNQEYLDDMAALAAELREERLRKEAAGDA